MNPDQTDEVQPPGSDIPSSDHVADLIEKNEHVHWAVKDIGLDPERVAIDAREQGVVPSEVIDRIQRLKQSGRRRLRGLEQNYKADANPLYAWEAWRISQGAGEPLPSFAADYLTRVANNFACMEAPTTGRVATAVANAAEFSTRGRGSPFEKARVQGNRGPMDPKENRGLIFGEVLAAHQHGNRCSLEDAIGEVADRYGLGDSTVKKYYYEFRDQYPSLRE